MEGSIDIFEPVSFDDIITKYEHHTYQPRSNNFLNNDEIRILINQQDLLTYPCESYIRITGKVLDGVKTGDTVTFPTINRNGFNFLFDEIRYEINGVEIDKVRDVGIVSTIKGYLLLPQNDSTFSIAGWEGTSHLPEYKKDGTFFIHVPLNFLLGFAADYRKIVTSAKQELILLRARSDKDIYTSTQDHKIQLETVEWHMPHVQINDEFHLKLMNHIKNDRGIMLPFRRWELHELPALRNTERDVWSVKTSTNLEKPRFVVLAFHADKRDKNNTSASLFNHCDIRNIKVFLNSESYPYNNLNLNIPKDYLLAYQMYTKFNQSFTGRKHEPYLSAADFLSTLFYVFDVSKQNESVKSSTVDLKIELEARKAFPANTRAYCLVICDSLVEYKPLTGTVQKLIS